MKQILLASLVLLLAGCESITHRATGRAPDQTYLLERDQHEIHETADFIIAELDERQEMDHIRQLLRVVLTHYKIKTGDNTYEVHYTGSWSAWHDPVYYIKLTQVGNTILIERFAFVSIGIQDSWPKESIEACI